MKTLQTLEVGDPVIRLLAGTVKMTLKVTAVAEDRIVCGAWEFSRQTGGEIDDALDWDGVNRTGSIIKPFNPPDAKTLAADFKAVLKEWLRPFYLRVIDIRNKAETNPGICHSHDFCDSNQAMINALQKHGIEFNGQDEAQHELINEAWRIAKAEGFAT